MLRIHEVQDFNILVMLVPELISPTARTGFKYGICIFGILDFLLVFVNRGDSALLRSVNSPSSSISIRDNRRLQAKLGWSASLSKDGMGRWDRSQLPSSPDSDFQQRN